MSNNALRKLLVASFLTTCAAKAADLPTRLSWQSFASDPTRVESLRRGIQAMIDRNTADKNSAKYRTSWEYWANIHGYFGPDAKHGEIADYIASAKERLGSNWRPEFDQELAGITDQTPPDATAAKVWDQCAHGDRWFLAWHRLYLFYFEKVLQDAAQDDDLRLPYWDYTDPQHLDMPAEFLPPKYNDPLGAEISNPLFTSRRANAWIPPQQTSLDADATNVDSVLGQGDFNVFQTKIQLRGSVHSYVHCSINDCPITSMGAVSYSANDPIFWLHHANIDRLWECWSRSYPSGNPTDKDFFNQTYTFVTPNGTEVATAVGDLFNGHLIDYKYEKVDNCTRAKKTSVSPSEVTVLAQNADTTAEALRILEKRFDAGVTIAQSQQELVITGKRASMQLNSQLQTADSKSAARNFVFNANPTLPVRSTMRLVGVSYDQTPGSMLNLYLQNGSDSSSRQYVGTLSFFDAFPPKRAHHTTAESPGEFDFDVTDALRKLGASAADSSNFRFVIETTTGRRGDENAGEVSEHARLRIKGVTVRAVRASLPIK